MMRILLSFVCCCSLLFSVSAVQSIDLVGPYGDSTSLAPAPLPNQYGPLLASETLWSVSTKLRPDTSVSVYQTLVAIYKLNPLAFKNGNINQIIPRTMINVPSKDFITKQTNKEAYQLLKPANKPANKPVKKAVINKKVKEPVVVTAALTEKIVVVPEVVTIPPEIFDALKTEVADKELALMDAKQKIGDHEKELLLLNEELLTLSESNQMLKSKLQPLTDQINALSEQVDEEIKIQNELQALIDEYKMQIEAFVEPPFSGEGVINEMLRGMTSSVFSLLATVLTPLLVLVAIFVVMLRIKSKRELALQEQEIAESTAILMEQSGKFDSLLTEDSEEDNSMDNKDEIDFSDELEIPPQEVQSDLTPSNDTTELVAKEVDDDIDLDIIDDVSEAINLDEISIPENEDFEELVTTEDDPFGIGALVEDNLIEDSEGSEGFDIDIDVDTLVDDSEEAIELSGDDLAVESESNQADLDLAAEWEAQLASEGDSDDVDIALETAVEAGVAEEPKPEIIDEVAAITEEPKQETIEEVVAVTEEPKPEVIDEVAAVTEEPKQETIEEVVAVTEVPKPEVIDEVAAVTEGPKPEIIEEVAEEVVAVTEEPKPEVVDEVAAEEVVAVTEEPKPEEIEEAIEEKTEEVKIDSFESDLSEDDLSEFENIDISSLKSVDATLSELDAELAEAPLVDDLVPPQLSSSVFNEDVPLPSIAEDDSNNFIDIETLLEGSAMSEMTEEDFDLDLGLEEYPDVVESFSEFENDNEGIGTQLDLARAYLEIDEKDGAKEILLGLLDTAQEEQLKEVKKLLERIN